MNQIIEILNSNNFWLSTIIPISLTATLSYYFTIRKVKIEKETDFSTNSTKEVENTYLNLLKITEEISLHAQDLNYFGKTINKDTLDFLTKKKNQIYLSYINLKTLEKKINNFPKYSFSKRHLNAIAENIHSLWSNLDYVTTTLHVEFIGAPIKISRFKEISKELLIRCSIFRYDVSDYYNYLQEITTRRSIMNKTYFVISKILISIPIISTIISLPIIFLRFLLFIFKKLIRFKPKKSISTDELIFNLANSEDFSNLNAQEIADKISQIFNEVLDRQKNN